MQEEKKRFPGKVIAKALAIGMGMGLVGVLVGVIPVNWLRTEVFELLKAHYGGYIEVPVLLRRLVWGQAMYIAMIIFLPVGGLLAGLAGAGIGLLCRSTKAWLWGGLAGFLFNFLVSFHAQ